MNWLRLGLLTILITLSTYWAVRRVAPQIQPTCFRCNIVIIMIDNLRADSLPCYGYRFNTTPNICSFANRNTLFTRAFSASSWTLPSIMSFFTSLYPSGHGIGVTLLNVLNPEIIPLPLYLKHSGYDTTFVSTNQPSVGLYQGLETGFTKKITVPNDIDQSLSITRKAVDDMEASNRRRKPAFLFIHTDGVHDYPNHLTRTPFTFPLDPEYVPPKPQTVPFTETVRQAALNTLLEHISFNTGSDIPLAKYRTWHKTMQSAPTLHDAEQIFLELPAEDRDVTLSHVIGPAFADRDYAGFLVYMRHVYDEYIRRTDLYVHGILTQLEKHNLMRNTIVIISSEHGELLGEGGLIGHGIKMYNPEINVPLIMRVPGAKPARIDDLIQHIDVYPTILDIIGKPKSDALRGVSFLPAIYGDHTGEKNPYVITEWTNSWKTKTIQNTEWKLFVEMENTQEYLSELYHLSADTHEKDIVTADYPQITDMLTSTLYDVLYAQPDYPPKSKPFPDWIDEEHRRNLIETGYFNRP